MARLARVVVPGDTAVQVCRYDGLGRRIQKIDKTGESDVTCDYYYNTGWQVVEVRRDADTDPYKQYVWDIRYIDAPVLRWRDGNTDGDLDDEGDDTLYYTNDANMNVTALVGTDGDVVERYMYDPYGQVLVLNGADDADDQVSDWSEDADNTSDWDNELLFAGYRFDSETGLYHVRHRMYHPTLGRWLQRDPIGYVNLLTLYAYVLNNPLSDLDPYGLLNIRNVSDSPKVVANNVFWAVLVFPSSGEIAALGRAGGGHIGERIHIEMAYAKCNGGGREWDRDLAYAPPLKLSPQGDLKLHTGYGPIPTAPADKPNERGETAYDYIVPINSQIPDCTSGKITARVDVELWSGPSPYSYMSRGDREIDNTEANAGNPLGQNELRHRGKRPYRVEPGYYDADMAEHGDANKSLSSGWAKVVVTWDWCDSSKKATVKIEAEGSKEYEKGAGPTRWHREPKVEQQRDAFTPIP